MLSKVLRFVRYEVENVILVVGDLFFWSLKVAEEAGGSPEGMLRFVALNLLLFGLLAAVVSL